MTKYEPLEHFLKGRPETEVPMKFSEIEAIIEAKLPASKQYPAWWSNNPSNNVMTQSWLRAGFQTERVDIARERLVFRRIRQQRGVQPARTPDASPDQNGADLFDRIRKRFAGVISIPAGVDITEPSGDVWDAQSK